jgi:ubiquinone/menaquinone biosynthesis C-methylase UbiE
VSQQDPRARFSASPPENYERYFVPAIGAPLAMQLVEVAALHPGERVLDVACGTGVVSRLASQIVGPEGTVVGLDNNSGMLAVARSTAPSGATFDWHEANAETMPLPDESFDVVLCQMGLQFVPDKPAALREMRRVLSPGGRLILNVPGPTPKPLAIMGEGIAHHIHPEAQQFVEHVFSLHDTEELQKLISEAGFHEVTVQANATSLPLPAPADFLWQYVQSTPLAAVVAQVDNEARMALDREVVERLQAFVKDDALMLQLRMLVATARK